MTQAASQAAAFYRDVAKARVLWTIRDDDGYPAPINGSGKRAMPFWSSLKRVQKIIATVPAYSGFRPVEVEWEKFVKNWAPGLTEDGLLVGVNWSGTRALGYDLQPKEVVSNVEAMIGHRTKTGTPGP